MKILNKIISIFLLITILGIVFINIDINTVQAVPNREIIIVLDPRTWRKNVWGFEHRKRIS